MEVFMDFIKNKKIIITTISILVLSLLGYIFFYISEEKNDITFVESEEISENSESEKINKTIFIDIAGEVVNPGLYELAEGSRVNDAIMLAGGLTEDADLIDINRAYILSDGLKIVIPSKNDTVNSVQGSRKININLATASELCTLDGIGESTAQKIINYRKAHGFFKSIEGIKNVPGIGDAKFNQFKDYITV